MYLTSDLGAPQTWPLLGKYEEIKTQLPHPVLVQEQSLANAWFPA